MDHTITEILLGYAVAIPLIVGAPAIFFLIVFMPSLMNTKGKWVGYKEYVNYGPSSINNIDRSQLQIGPDVPVRELSWPLKVD